MPCFSGTGGDFVTILNYITYLFVLIFSMGLALAGMMAGTKMGSSKLAKSLSSSKSEKLEKELLGTL